MNEMLNNKVWAVIGATDNTEKFGYKIYKKLKSVGYEVYPVNPNCSDIEGDKCFPDLSSLPKRPEAIDMVVSPKKGIPIIEEASNIGIHNVWFQPGTVDGEILELTRTKGMNAVQGCVLVELG